MKQRVNIMTLINSVCTSNVQKNESIKVLGVIPFKDSIQPNDTQLIDVRTPLEFNSGHISGAKNIDFYSGKFNIEFNKLNKEKPVFLYCRSGNRSRQAANKLLNMGFTEIYDLEGGYLNWTN